MRLSLVFDLSACPLDLVAVCSLLLSISFSFYSYKSINSLSSLISSSKRLTCEEFDPVFWAVG